MFGSHSGSLLIFFAIAILRAKAQLNLTDLFPFGLTNGDKNLTSGNMDSGPIDMGNFPFFNKVFNQLFVGTKGMVSTSSAQGDVSYQCNVTRSYAMIAPYL